VRRLQLKVHDEPSYASIEEVAEDVGKAEAVEKTADAAEEIKKVGEAARKVVTVVQENQVEKVIEAVEAAGDTTQTVIVAEISSPTSCEEKEKIEIEKKVELDHSAVDKVEAVGEAATVVKENEAAVTQNAVAIISPARSEEKKVKVVAEDNSDTPPYEYLNDLPSYEEFVNGAAPEPLFEQKSFEVDYGMRHFLLDFLIP
jgi:predicted HAD superfamily phosphohydrolase